VHGALVGVHGGQLALGVVQLLGAVDAGAQLDAVGDQEVELLVVHQREVADHGELQLLAELGGAVGWRTRRRGGRPGS
jgi:hypothetical protein